MTNVCLAAASTSLLACGPKVTETSDYYREQGYTHQVDAGTMVANVLNRSGAGSYQGMLRTALEFCGLPKDSDPQVIRFKRSLRIYFTSQAVFACPAPGKDAQ